MSASARVLERTRRQAGRAWRGARLLAARVDPRPRALPDFVIIGAQKSGTSSLYGQVAAHPAVVPALRKEVHHFDRRPAPLARYRAYFPRQEVLERVARREGRAVTGEASPYYLFHPGVPGRMHAVLPDVRLVAVLREPAARAISAYHHAVRSGHEHRPIEEALAPEAEEPLAPVTDLAWYDAPDCPARRRGYLARSRYAEQLERWFAVYPREQILVVESSALRAGQAPKSVLAFLGLPPLGITVPDRNVGAYPPASSAIEERLRDHFRPDNARLFALLGVDWGWPT